MVSWGVRARSWNAKSPEEQRLEYATHRLEAYQDRLHGQIKNETRLLNEVADVASQGARDARRAHIAASMYGYGSPYARTPYDIMYTPPLSAPIISAHARHAYGAPLMAGASLPGIGISPHLDPAYTAGHMQARREMAVAQQIRRRRLQQQQVLAQRQALDDMVTLSLNPGLRTRALTMTDSPSYMGRSPYLNDMPYVPSTHLSMGTPFLGSTPYLALRGLDPMMGAVSFCPPTALSASADRAGFKTPRMAAPLYDPLMDRPDFDMAYAELAALNVPPGSIRLRRLSTPSLAPIDPILS